MFMVLVTLPTLWVVLRPSTELQANTGTIAASLTVGLVGWWFLYRERIQGSDIGLDRRRWVEGIAVFFGWWLMTTIVDLIGSSVVEMFGLSLLPTEILQWSAETVLNWVGAWIVTGLAEEIAFRAYLHNRLAAALGRRWLGIVLAALLFSLWHIPGSIAAGRFALNKLLTTLVIAVFSLVLFNLTYEWTGLLPFLALFHGWSDFPLLITLRRPTAVGAVAGYLLVFVVLWLYAH
jgi:membrane protease YdiL (CAAX protease family)